jgi:hydroxymethylglutaryl-CoA reductase
MGVPGMIQGFSKLSREDQARLLASFTDEPSGIENELSLHRLADREKQDTYDGFSENTLSNFFLPYSVAPNFRINDRYYIVPMVTEESSVVAAAASAAKFWLERGGFHTRIRAMYKPGHIHFTWKGSHAEIAALIDRLIPGFHEVTSSLTRNMRARGGGIEGIRLIDMSDKLEGYHQIEVIFNTAESMGANFINSCLESMASFLRVQVDIAGLSDRLTIIMAILSNYTPRCLVECSVSCHPRKLANLQYGLKGIDFARKFETAVNLAQCDVSRAVTHNKGIYNGIDAVVIATGNDFRAVEADGHAYASRDGIYRGLTRVELASQLFACRLEVPLNLGTIGGLTRSHPMVRVSMKILGNPDVAELMSVASAAGLASNFSAIKELITGGIQRGHMLLHLSNLLQQLSATAEEKTAAMNFFREHLITHNAVEGFLMNLRSKSRISEK